MQTLADSQQLDAVRRTDELDDPVGQPEPDRRRVGAAARRSRTSTATPTSTSASATPARWPATPPRRSSRRSPSRWVAVRPSCCRPRTRMWVAEEMTRRFGMAHWQFCLTASDANRFVLRLARQITGRSKIVVHNWCYHGSVDETLATLDDSGEVIARRGSVGPQLDVAQTTRVVEINDLDGARAGARRRAGRVRAGRAGADQHRHRAAGRRLPPRAAPDHPRDRHAADHRRDPHHLRRPGRIHRPGRAWSRTCSRSARRSAAVCRSRRTA